MILLISMAVLVVITQEALIQKSKWGWALKMITLFMYVYLYWIMVVKTPSDEAWFNFIMAFVYIGFAIRGFNKWNNTL